MKLLNKLKGLFCKNRLNEGMSLSKSKYKWITQDEFNEVLTKHFLWIQGFKGGEQANLSGVDLTQINFRPKLRINKISSERILLQMANLTNTKLTGVDLSGETWLFGSDLSGADLSSANLKRALLNRVNFKGADLSGADLQYVELRKADFTDANLERTDFKKAYLYQADLSEAYMNFTNFAEATLEDALIKVYNSCIDGLEVIKCIENQPMNEEGVYPIRVKSSKENLDEYI